MSVDKVEYKLSTSDKECADCKHFKAYYEKTQNKYVKSRFGWCVVKHNHLFEENYCDRFIQKEEENYQINIKRILEEFSVLLSEYSMIVKNEVEERDNAKDNDKT